MRYLQENDGLPQNKHIKNSYVYAKYEDISVRLAAKCLLLS